jgi:hypothetical protein
MIKEFTRTGSYKGVQFNYRSSDRGSGRKTIYHTFPNSDEVQFEDLGRLPRSFSMELLITGIGQDYFGKRDALLKVLDSPDKGELIHPLYGKMTVTVAGEYSTNEIVTSQGRLIINVTFVRVDSFTVGAKPNAQSIDQIRDNILIKSKEVTKGIEKNSGVPLSETPTVDNSNIGADGLGEVAEVTNDFLEGVQSIKRNITGISEKFATISRLIQNPQLYSNYSAIIREFELTNLTDIADIIDEVGELFTKGRSAIDDAQLWLSGIQSTYGYNDDVDETPAITRQGAESRANDIAFRNLVQTIGVAFSATAFIETDFTTLETLQTEELSIMTQLDKVSNLSNLDDDLFRFIKDLKNNLRIAVDQKKLTVFTIDTITVKTTTLTTLVHSLYGNLDNYDIIRDLNSFNDPSFIEGDVQVVTGG